MDLGEPFKHEMRIKPGEDGSFVVVLGEALDHGRTPAPFFGFTTIDDLLIWMAKHGAKADPRQPGVTELSEGDVIDTHASYVPGSLAAHNAKWEGLSAVRRTTAAEIIAEREQRNSDKPWSNSDKPTNAA